MKATKLLDNPGKAIWLDNITRDLLTSCMVRRYVDEFSVTGLTSNPAIFNNAIKSSNAYAAAIRKKVGEGKVKNLKKLPPGCRLGDNAFAFEGGFRLREPAMQRKFYTPRPSPRPDVTAPKGECK